MFWTSSRREYHILVPAETNIIFVFFDLKKTRIGSHLFTSVKFFFKRLCIAEVMAYFCDLWTVMRFAKSLRPRINLNLFENNLWSKQYYGWHLAREYTFVDSTIDLYFLRTCYLHDLSQGPPTMQDFWGYNFLKRPCLS